jgi:hypothetical protein
MNIETFTQVGSDGITIVEMVKIDNGVTATVMAKSTYDEMIAQQEENK